MCENLEKNYDPKESEEEIYKFWEENEYFKPSEDKSKKSYTIVMPPPNITGNLHMGHALDQTMQDIMIRFKRMQGYSALWIPGTDHASIATEAKIMEEMRKEGVSKESLGREGFLKRAWKWKNKYGSNITRQLKKLGVSCDWSKERFTLDDGCSKAVKEFFIKLYENGLIYRGKKIINWCPKCLTSISDSEVNFEELDGHFWFVRYKLLDENRYIDVATTRPETMFGDVALAVNPNDKRYEELIGKKAIVPIIGREIPIVGDEYVDMEVGTGVLKITPAHDPNDFEIGLRHNLPIIEVMDEKAFMNEISGSYCGLDRNEARKQFVKKLKEEGYISKIEDLRHNVGKCYRCSTIIEPRLSTQWFVKMETLAKKSLKCVKNGNIEFVPSRFSKIYYHWMENIKDWCISRQLWWGHRIPVWYCEDCGEIIVSKDEEVRECKKCFSKNIKKEEDTLDTWFSSGLWPFSVLGWPNDTEDLKRFFPTDLLVTGYDIIFFWVAKMIFSSLEMTNKPPFKQILIHGLVRDAQGRKMSKSLGNGIDPLEIIDKYGADALRFSLILGTSPGNDLRFYIEKVEASRNFANKIWNAARFIRMKLSEREFNKEKNLNNLDSIDAWIISRLNKVIEEVTLNIEKLDLGLAAQKIYDFVWDEFCDWYIEFCKISDRTAVLLNVFKNILKLIHPFMPFVTERIWRSFEERENPIIISEFPKCNLEHLNKAAEKEIEILMSIIKTVRNLRREMNIPQGKKAVINIEAIDSSVTEILNNYREEFCKLSYIKELNIADKFDNSGCVTSVNEYAKIYMPLEDLIDKKSELIKLKKELEISKSQLDQASKRLNNRDFVSKAPKHVVEGAKEVVRKLEDKIFKLNKSIEELE